LRTMPIQYREAEMGPSVDPENSIYQLNKELTDLKRSHEELARSFDAGKNKIDSEDSFRCKCGRLLLDFSNFLFGLVLTILLGHCAVSTAQETYCASDFVSTTLAGVGLTWVAVAFAALMVHSINPFGPQAVVRIFILVCAFVAAMFGAHAGTAEPRAGAAAAGFGMVACAVLFCAGHRL